jgi:subtilisin family serine protease
MRKTLKRTPLLLVFALAVACDRPESVMSPVQNSRNAVAEKIGPGVLEAIRRGEQPAISVSLRAARHESPDRMRAEVAEVQEGVLQRVADHEVAVRRRFAMVPALSAIAHSEEALMRMAADPRVRRIDLDVGGGGALANSVPHIRADLRHARGNDGSGVVVAVFDTGFDSDHTDLAGALVHEACFGFRPADSGGNFCPDGTDRQTGLGSAEDDQGHGTHVTGIVTALGEDAGPGVAPAASIAAIKVLDDRGAAGIFYSWMEIVAGFDYILANPDIGVRVINLSLSTTLRYAGVCDDENANTQAGADAVAALREAGVLVVAAAGNNSDTNMGLPACLSGVISVGAANNDDVPAGFTNSNATTDVFAPGVNIVSLQMGGGPRTASGTSMAAPHVAACAALLIQAGDATTPAAIEARIRTSASMVTRNGIDFPRLDCAPDENQLPVLTVNNATVQVDEGSTATNGGNVSDPDGDPVTLSASVGTVIDNGDGTWSWSFATVDGPAQSQTVTVTATDALGETGTVNFQLVVRNVAPSVEAGPDASIQSNETFHFSSTFSDPGAIDFQWVWVIAWGDGTSVAGSTGAQSLPITSSRQFCAAQDYTIRLTVNDKDGGSGFDEMTLSVAYRAIAIRILPDGHPNPISLASRGRLTVAVLSTADFDARQLDPATVVLGDENGTDTPVARRNNGTYFASVEDVDGDGRPDLVLHFEMPALVANGDLTRATTQLVLRGFLRDGCTNVRGADSVRVVP